METSTRSGHSSTGWNRTSGKLINSQSEPPAAPLWIVVSNSRVSVSCTLSMRGPKPHRLLQAIPEKFQQAPRTGIEPVFAWFRARCNDQQLPPRCKTIISTPSGNRTRSAGFKGPRRVYAPERIAITASSGGWARTITRLLNREPPYRLGHTGFLNQQSGWLDLNQRSRAPEARGLPNFPTP